MSGKGMEGDVPGQRQDRLIKERVHDTYMTRGRPKEPAICPDCGAVSTGGRWQWLDEPPAGGSSLVCPACQRIRDRVPAGLLTLSGRFVGEHWSEIRNLLDNKVAAEQARRPLKRIMAINREGDEIVVSFTDRHLPRGLGEALSNAYQGTLDIHFTEGAGLIRAYWHRD